MGHGQSRGVWAKASKVWLYKSAKDRNGRPEQTEGSSDVGAIGSELLESECRPHAGVGWPERRYFLNISAITSEPVLHYEQMKLSLCNPAGSTNVAQPETFGSSRVTLARIPFAIHHGPNISPNKTADGQILKDDGSTLLLPERVQRRGRRGRSCDAARRNQIFTWLNPKQALCQRACKAVARTRGAGHEYGR